jgi:cytochrome c heme-lyase
VDRCGTKIEYIIDFYAGKNEGKGGKLNFYLDVRPKLNTWEGWKMRGAKTLGLV